MRRIIDIFYGRGAGDFETNESFQILFQCWALIGIKPLKPYGFFRTTYMLLCWICLLMSPFVFNVGFMQTVQNSSMTVILTTLQASLNVLALPLKAIVTAVYLQRLRSVEPIFRSLDAPYQRARERLVIKNTVIKSTHLFVVVGGMYFVYGTITSLSALFTHSQPQNTWLPFIDWIPEPTINFWLHFLFEVLYIYFLLISQFTNDLYPAIYLKTLRTHITLLAERVSRLGENPSLNDDDNYSELIDCVRSHQKWLQISSAVGSVFSYTIFLQFTVVAAILCVCMLNIFIYADASRQAITIVYYICVLLQTLPTCYQASRLEADSTKLPNAIFHCNWLALDKRSRRLLIYFMHGAQKEICFVAIKLFRINLGTNLSIAKFSFTLYTFINKMGVQQNIKQ